MSTEIRISNKLGEVKFQKFQTEKEYNQFLKTKRSEGFDKLGKGWYFSPVTKETIYSDKHYHIHSIT